MLHRQKVILRVYITIQLLLHRSARPGASNPRNGYGRTQRSSFIKLSSPSLIRNQTLP